MKDQENQNPNAEKPNPNNIKSENDKIRDLDSLGQEVKQIQNKRICKDIVQGILKLTFKKAKFRAKERKERLKSERTAEIESISKYLVSSMIDEAVS